MIWQARRSVEQQKTVEAGVKLRKAAFSVAFLGALILVVILSVSAGSYYHWAINTGAVSSIQ